MRHPLLRWIFALLGPVLVVAPTQAREWFVQADGSDSTGDGSHDAPFRSLTHLLDTSLDLVADGDVITLGGGRYEECEVRLRKRLVLRAADGARPHIHCSIARSDSSIIWIDPEASGSRVSGLELSGGKYYGIKLETAWYRGGGESGRGASDVVLEDLRIHDTGRDGIKLTPRCDGVTIRRVKIWNTGVDYPPGTPMEERNAEGIDNVGASRMVVEDSHIHHTATTGIYAKGGAADVVIQRNRVEDTGLGGILVGFDTSEEYFDLDANPDYFESLRATVRNNVVRNTAYAGIGLYAARDAIVAGNTLVDTARRGHAAIWFGVPLQDEDPKAGRPPSRGARIVNNLVLQDTGACAGIAWWPGMGGTPGLLGGPGSDWNAWSRKAGACTFTDARPGAGRAMMDLAGWQAALDADAHSLEADLVLDADGCLPADSPARGRGTLLDALPDDRNGRPRGAAPDPGACQGAYSSSSAAVK